uniref:Tenascin-like protein n=1 Tax=Timema monikensis TaxID=170555 RepID=A0A7R9HL15_9NEOP|nr:unnamed protein product [Timema monikensis]
MSCGEVSPPVRLERDHPLQPAIRGCPVKCVGTTVMNRSALKWGCGEREKSRDLSPDLRIIVKPDHNMLMSNPHAQRCGLYLVTVSSMRPSMDSTSCILVEDAKAEAQDEEPRDVTSSQAPTEESLPTSTAVHSSHLSLSSKLSPGSNTDQQQQQQQQQQWPAVVEVREYGVPHASTIPPFQFWNSEFRNKEPAFIRLNFTLPWGANFAVYGRRNVAPSVTQYDFVEFIKGGRVDHRLKRSVDGGLLMVGSLDPTRRGEDMIQFQSPAAVSFTTSTTQKWRDHRGDVLHVIPPPLFIVNHNHLEKSPGSSEDVSEGLGVSTTEKVSSWLSGGTKSKRLKSRNSTRHRKTPGLPAAPTNQEVSRRKRVVVGHKVSRRSSGIGISGSLVMMVNVTLLQYLDTGRWFLSVYNDDLRPQEVTLVVAEAEGVSTACPNDCGGHGSCYLGKCDCIDGYEGVDCSKSVCPVLCSNHGKYGGGMCHCEEGWKGPECDIPEHDCQVPDCSGHGQCLGGVCICRPGWKGTFCNQVDCVDPLCSSHGSCVGGKCYCKAGWQGVNCSIVDQQVYQCLPGCSEHGSYDLEMGACICENYWSGTDCSQALCSLDCGPHGRCDKGKCECDIGWTGDRCDLLPCDPRCSEHGQCKNGTCVCSQGWNGRHCTLYKARSGMIKLDLGQVKSDLNMSVADLARYDFSVWGSLYFMGVALPGCRSACNHHGTCTLEDSEYHCVCSDGWAGLDCSIRLELECDDDIDNDEDGMTDCSDSECCNHHSCTEHIMCHASNDPVEVLLRKQPPSVTASFYQRVKFLIEENSVQSYAHMDEYSESRVSVMRGQVVTPQGLGIVGIRVSVDRDSRFGFTLTRAGGWFDVLVNGGGAVTLQFQRNPFLPLTRTVFVPWNQIVVLPPIAMQLSDESDLYREHGSSAPGLPNNLPGRATPLFGGTQRAPCLDHDHELLRPVIMSTWMPEKVGAMPGRCLVLAETQILQESIQIPGSSLHLMYQSSQAPGYLSTVLMRLTHSTVPTTLTHVHVRVEIEGSVHTRAYEADPHLTHTFAWNKRNVYKQKVYGVAQAKISVGYQYSSCPSILWETQTAVLQGFDVDISDVGGWSLDIHHHYNFHEGILQNKEGNNLLFKHCHEFSRRVMAPSSTSSTIMFGDFVTGILQKEEGTNLHFKHCHEFSRRKKAPISTSSTAMFNDIVTGILQNKEGNNLLFKHCHEFSRRVMAPSSTSSTIMFGDFVTGILQKEDGTNLHFKHCHEFSRRKKAPISTSSTAMFNDIVTGILQNKEGNNLLFKHCHEFSRRNKAITSTSSTAMFNDNVTGILQKGDGTTLHFKQYPRTVKVVMGTGLQRPLMCSDCNGSAKDSRLLTPVALTSGPDGSLYVGDFNLVRRITPEGNVYTVLQLSTTQVSYQYYLSVSPADGHLYISNSEKHQILRALSVEPVEEPAINYEPVVGSGERCIPGDETHCGDEGPARDAKLAHPKGLAIAADKTMYIADGTNIRAVDPQGVIHTLVGHHGHHNHWTPVPCHGAIPAQQAQLQWPTGLSLSPLDGSLHFIDDRLVLKLTDDLKVKVVAGTPLHCHASTVEHHQGSKTDTTTGVETAETQIQGVPESEEGSKATSTVLGSVLALAFSPTGDLFIAESDSRKVNAIRVVDSAGRISDFAGKQQEKLNRMQSCDCNSNSSLSTTPGGATLCPCGGLLPDDTAPDHNSKETMLSSTAQFTSISALTVSPDGVLNVADQGSLHILALEHYLPTHDENGEFRIPYPPTREVYVFNRYGQHIATKDLTSGKTRYSFLYSKNTSFGKLSTVTDSSGNKILFLRDYSNVVSTIENTQDHKSDLKISGVGFLVKFTEKGKMEIELDYDSSTGLLTSRSDSHGGGGGETFMYHYGDHGRLIDVVLPTGETMNLASHLTPDDGLAIQVSAGVQSSLADMDQQLQHLVLLKMEGQGAKKLVARDGPLAAATEAASFLNGSFSVRSSWGGQLTCAAMARHPLLELSLPVEAEMLTMWSQQVLTLGDSLVNTMQWTYSLVGDVRTTQQTLHKELWVNQSRVLGIEFDQANGRETFYDRDRQALFIVSFDPAGLPQSWAPAGGGLPVNITYDRFNRVDGWKWGVQSEKYSYESHGLLSEISSPQDGTTKYTYNDLNILSHISLPSQRTFSLKYDEDGGLRHVTLPGGTHHSFSCQPSLGFLRVTYTPPGSVRAYIQHYSHSGALLQTVFPGDGARVLYRYHPSGQLAEVLHGDGRSQLNYSPVTSFPSEVLHSERDFEYRWDYQFQAGLLTEERLDFGAKTGLSNAKFTYEYDTNFRLTGVQGRIGGQNLPEHSLGYNSRTGAPEQLGQFKVSRTKSNETSVYDGTAIFSRINNPHFQDVQVAVTIHRMEVFRMEFTHDSRSQTRTYTRNVGVNTYTNVKNYTWDSDGQLSGVEAQEPWGFRYDDNGNMLSLTYRGNTIPMEYNVMDRIVKFGEGLYRYDNRGLVVQNAREERFHYNAKGLLVRATKRGRFDVRYYYDHLDRLATRKDNYGNVTQFFYTNHQRPNEVSQIYSPRDGKLMSLVYDDRGHLIFAQVYRHKYYVATDQCGTPIMVFNQYGEGIREIMRSPYGHIVYDSNPYLYLPVDFCGGLLDKVTSLVHMPNGKVYDPLIGQWMSPMWEGVLDRVANPTHLHLYRFNGNDPINVRRNPQHLTGGGLPPSMVLLGAQPPLTPHVMTALSSVQLRPGGSGPAPFTVASGFLAQLTQRRLGDASTLSSPPRSAVKRDTWPPEDFPATNPASVFPLRRLGSACDPPFGRGILVSRTTEGKAIINSVPTANAIYRDVFTSVFNQSYLLPFTFFHNMQQDVFYFVKEDPWRAADDRGQLKRLGGQVNTTFHEKEAGSQEGSNKEKQRLLHHAKVFAVRKAWHREKEALRNGFAGSVDWSATEMDEILKVGYAASYDGEYVHDVQRYPELAEDPFNVRFMKKTASTTSEAVKRRRKKRSMFQEEGESIQGKMSLSSMFRDLSFPSPGSLKEMLLSSDEIKSCSNSKHWWLPWTHHRPAC